MPANFLSLAGELRNKIYEPLLVIQEPIVCPKGPWGRRYQYQRRALNPGLLRVNKVINVEATSMLYAHNCFDFSRCTSQEAISFLEQIGLKNASSILHIRVQFPKFRCLRLNYVTLEEENIRFLERIQSNCTKLDKLTTSLTTTHAIERKLNALEYPEVIAEALALVDSRFRAISSLRDVVVEVLDVMVKVYHDGSSVRSEMRNHGWVICATKSLQDASIETSSSVGVSVGMSRGSALCPRIMR